MNLSLIKYHFKNKLLQIKQYFRKDDEYIPSTEFLLDLYGLPNDIMNRIKIVSFCNKNIHPNVPLYQKKVFNKFQLTLEQFIDDYPHPFFLNKVLTEVTDKDYVIIFDIDAIPLKKQSVFCMIQDLHLGYKLVGAVQTANQYTNGKNNYIGPFFMGLSIEFYRQIQSPNLDDDGENDVAGILTKICKQNNLPHKYWMPTHIEIPKWNLFGIGKFGLGTIYNGLIYHAFQVRDGNHYRFINKCKQVLSSN